MNPGLVIDEKSKKRYKIKKKLISSVKEKTFT
jgi:hypothetical protein